jgi:hypothetical protein
MYRYLIYNLFGINDHDVANLTPTRLVCPWGFNTLISCESSKSCTHDGHFLRLIYFDVTRDQVQITWTWQNFVPDLT